MRGAGAGQRRVRGAARGGYGLLPRGRQRESVLVCAELRRGPCRGMPGASVLGRAGAKAGGRNPAAAGVRVCRADADIRPPCRRPGKPRCGKRRQEYQKQREPPQRKRFATVFWPPRKKRNACAGVFAALPPVPLENTTKKRQTTPFRGGLSLFSFLTALRRLFSAKPRDKNTKKQASRAQPQGMRFLVPSSPKVLFRAASVGKMENSNTAIWMEARSTPTAPIASSELP